MSALLESLLQDQPAEVAAALRAIGLPGTRSEAWKYTSLRALERRTFAPPSPVRPAPQAVADIPAPRLVFVNGRFDAALSDLAALPPGIEITPTAPTDEIRLPDTAPTAWHSPADDVFAHLACRLAREGARIRVTAKMETPLHLVSLQAANGSDHASHLHHRLQLAPGAHLTLVEHQISDAEHAGLDNSLVHLDLEAGARLTHLRMQADSAKATRFLRSEAHLAADAHYRRMDLELGAALSRHELNVCLAGPGARFEGGGVLLADGRRHLDTRLGITHAAPDTHAELPWRALADGRARAVFHGGITIQAGADGCEANLQNRNLLLSDDAEIDTQPVLVIHADEVKAAHGASVGQLDANALFYLRSRGIPEPEARRILTAAFCHDLLTWLDSASLRALAETRINTALAQVQA